MEAQTTRPDLMRRQVLIVEDDAINRQLLGYIVSRDFEVLYAENGRQALDIIQAATRRISLVLLDLMMPVMNGFDTLRALQADEKTRQIPVIVLTAETEAEVDTLRMGASDFIKKPFDMPEVILARLHRTVELAEDRSLIGQIETDGLTGLYTKEFFCQYAAALEQSSGGRQMDAVVVDLDHFHLYNEMYGRQAGDAVLRCVADALREALGDDPGLACRCEADTFYLYLPHRDSHEALLRLIAGHVSGADRGIIHVRMGVCTRTDLLRDIVGRFDRARAACNTVRGNYLRSIAYYDEQLYSQDIRAQRLVGEMKDAIREKQFQVYYQPKYDVQGNSPRLASAEALVRWQHPELGLISPGVFIPLFENNGMIRELDAFVWRETARQVAAWQADFGLTLPVSVNVSRIDLHDEGLLDTLTAICHEAGIPVSALPLEVTESAYAEDSEQALQAVHRLRAAGFRVGMDDFGSGYSSLNMLLDMPVDALKIDARFMRTLSAKPENSWLIATLVDIARHLGVPTIFEGVEEERQVQLIRAAGGHVIQGYYFSKPLPLKAFNQLLKRTLHPTDA